VIVFWLPVTLKVWLIVAPVRFVIELTPPPETDRPLLSVPALSMVFWLPATLKVWLMNAPAWFVMVLMPAPLMSCR
jgi:hypothetical protein